MTLSPRRLVKFAAALACGFALDAALPVMAPSLGSTAHAQSSNPAQAEQFRATLSRFGAFQAHARYGEVWIPAEATAPAGWHPYPPCNWVHTKDLGWYYDDRSEWGRIVHHYGRWAHDASLGWVWVMGEEFSPGWVVWRTSDTWVGWAPLPPERDVREISAEAFNTDKHWIFIDAKKFGTRCDGGTDVTNVALYPTILRSTRLVTEIRLIRGIAVFVLPPPLIINIVDIDINVFTPWTPCFFGAWFFNWNWIVNNIIINVALPPSGIQCPQPGPQPGRLLPLPIKQLQSDPPPPPGGRQPKNTDRRTEDQPGSPTRLGLLPTPPTGIIRPIDPPSVKIPDRKGPPTFKGPERNAGSTGKEPGGKVPRRPLTRDTADDGKGGKVGNNNNTANRGAKPSNNLAARQQTKREPSTPGSAKIN